MAVQSEIGSAAGFAFGHEYHVIDTMLTVCPLVLSHIQSVSSSSAPPSHPNMVTWQSHKKQDADGLNLQLDNSKRQNKVWRHGDFGITPSFLLVGSCTSD